MNQYCPACSSIVVSPSGRSTSLLIVEDAPRREDYLTGHLFSTHSKYTTAGYVLRKELERAGSSIQDFRLASLWMHEPNKEENCWKAGFNNILDEAKDKKAILLLGADTVEAFTQYKVSDVSGLQVDSAMLSAPIIFALMNPSLALVKGLGEVRQGIEKFVALLEKEGLLK